MEGCLLTQEGWTRARLAFGERIERIEWLPDGGGDLPRIVPGFIDLHVHGGAQDELLSTAQAAEILEMSQEYVSRLIKKKKLDGWKMGGFFVVTRQSVEEYKVAIAGKSKNDPTR
jgi:excisionase family DNA binding protein